MIYDSYDISIIDPSGHKEPINFTNGYGRKHHIKFELINDGLEVHDLILNDKREILLTAVNEVNKGSWLLQQNIGNCMRS